jgi:hypothetical protein
MRRIGRRVYCNGDRRNVAYVQQANIGNAVQVNNGTATAAAGNPPKKLLCDCRLTSYKAVSADSSAPLAVWASQPPPGTLG